MVRVYAGVNIRNDSRARQIELALGLSKLNYLCCRLIYVALPSDGAVILHWRRVDERRRRRGGCGAAGSDGNGLIKLCVQYAGQGGKQGKKNARVFIGRSQDEKYMIQAAV